MSAQVRIPGPTGLAPVAKTAIGFINPNKRNRLINEYTAKYGDFVRVPLPMGAQAIFVGKPDLIQQMLKLPTIRRGYGQNALKDRMGKVVSSDGPEYLSVRRAIGPLLDRKTIPSYVSIVTEETQAMLHEWRRKTSTTDYDLPTEMGDLLFRIVPRTVLRSQPLPDGFADQLRTYILAFGDFELQRMIRPSWMWGTIKGNAQYAKLQDHVYQTMYALIDAMTANGATHEGLLGVLLEQYKAGTLTKDEVIAEFVGLFIASYETTSNTTGWALVHLAETPEAYQKLHEEAVRVLGTDTSVLPTHEALHGLEYAMLCVKETARLDPPTGVHVRQVAPEDGIDFGGYPLKQGTLLFGLAYKVHRDADIWGADGERFRPERMIESAMTPEQKEAYLPWATGIHKCAGEDLSKAEAALILAMIAREYSSIRLTEPLDEPVYKLVKEVPPTRGKIEFIR